MSWRTFCRMLMVLTGISCLALIGFLIYDTVQNFIVCQLPVDIFGRLFIALAAVYISMRCGLIPSPNLTCNRCPAPWKIWKCFCCRKPDLPEADDPTVVPSQYVDTASQTRSQGQFQNDPFARPENQQQDLTSDEIYAARRKGRAGRNVQFPSEVIDDDEARQRTFEEVRQVRAVSQPTGEGEKPVTRQNASLPLHMRCTPEQRLTLGIANHRRPHLTLIGLKMKSDNPYRQLPASRPSYNIMHPGRTLNPTSPVTESPAASVARSNGLVNSLTSNFRTKIRSGKELVDDYIAKRIIDSFMNVILRSSEFVATRGLPSSDQSDSSRNLTPRESSNDDEDPEKTSL